MTFKHALGVRPEQPEAVRVNHAVVVKRRSACAVPPAGAARSSSIVHAVSLGRTPGAGSIVSPVLNAQGRPRVYTDKQNARDALRWLRRQRPRLGV